MAGGIGTLLLFASGISSAVPAGGIFELQSDGTLATSTSRGSSVSRQSPSAPTYGSPVSSSTSRSVLQLSRWMQTGPRPPPPAPPVQPPVRAPLGQGDATQYTQPRYSQLLPSTFQSDDIFLDKTEVRGLQLHRHVQPTQRSRRVGLAGTAILDLPLTRLLRGGDHALRALSNGRYSTPVMAQTIAEAVLLTSILKALRGREVAPCYMCYMCYMGLTRQPAELPHCPGSLLYVLYVLYGSHKATR